MDANFWESRSSRTGSGEETPRVEIAQASQFEFGYEYSDEDSEMETSHTSEDDGYYGSGEDSSDAEDFEGAYTPPESLPNPRKGSLATSSYDSPSSLESPPYSGFIRGSLVQQRQGYEQWVKSQAVSSSSQDIPEIHSPVPRRLVEWDRFNL